MLEGKNGRESLYDGEMSRQECSGNTLEMAYLLGEILRCIVDKGTKSQS